MSETMTTPKPRKKTKPESVDASARTGQIISAVKEWRLLNNAWSEPTGPTEPGPGWWSALVEVVRTIGASQVPLPIRTCVDSALQLGQAIVDFAASDVDLDWNSAVPSNRILGAIEGIEKAVLSAPEAPEPKTVAELDGIGSNGRNVTPMSDTAICRATKLSPAELVQERKTPGSQCDPAWRERMQAQWLTDYYGEPPDYEILSAVCQKLSGIGLD